MIELSIVLIIIGLLVAGITSGQSLIESAKARAVMNEARGYMQAVNTYYAAKGRLPGDPDNTGTMGDFSDSSITESDYATNINNANAPWFDLNREVIVDYDVNTEISKEGKESKYIKKTIYKFVRAKDDFNNNTHAYEKDLANTNIMDLSAKYDGYIPSRIAANIEEKMDDKSLDAGSVRMGLCSSTIPENSNMIDGGFGKEETTGYGDITTYKDLVDAKNGAYDEITFKLSL